MKKMTFKALVSAIFLSVRMLSHPLEATWQPAVVVSNPLFPTEELDGGPVLGVNSLGNAVAVWTSEFSETFPDQTNITASFYLRGIGWAPPQIISSLELNANAEPLYQDQSNPDVAINSSNYAVAVWDGSLVIPSEGDLIYDIVMSSVRQLNGIWTPVAVISDTDLDRASSRVNVALNEAGTAVAAWRQQDFTDDPTINRTLISILPFSSTWQTPVPISDDEFDIGIFENRKPYVVINERGDIAVIWFRGISASTYGIDAATFNATTATWSLPVTLDSFVGSIDAFEWNPRIAIDEAGNAVAIWTLNNDVKTAYFTQGSGWGPNQILASNGVAGGDEATGPTVVVDPAGNATAVWENLLGQIVTAYKPFGLAWGPPQVISTGTDNSFEPSMSQEPLAVDDNGNLMALWRDGSNVIVSSYRIFNLPWQAPETVFSAAPGENISVGLADCGFAVALWETGDVVMSAVNENYFAPIGLRIQECTQKFAMQKVRLTLFDWTPFDPECILSYNIYCNEDLIKAVSSFDPPSFIFTEGCRRHCNYTLTTTNIWGFESDPVPFIFD